MELNKCPNHHPIYTQKARHGEIVIFCNSCKESESFVSRSWLKQALLARLPEATTISEFPNGFKIVDDAVSLPEVKKIIEEL